MLKVRYSLAKLRTDYYLSGINQRLDRNQRIPSPAYVVWDCTRRCNLKCIHCGATKETYDHEISTEQIRSLLDELSALKVKMFGVTGGEPLLRNDLLEVLMYAKNLGMQTGIATNGLLIDRLMAARMRDSGVDSIQVSLDGLERTHNRIRGSEISFIKAAHALEHLAAVRIPRISVATTVTNKNISELGELGQWLQKSGVKLWRLAVVMPIGRAQASDLSINGQQLTGLLEYIRVNDRKGMRIYLGENLPFLGEWEKKVRSGPLICPIGITACCIGVNGSVRGCPEQPDISANREGSILKRSFAEIWQNGFLKYRRRTILIEDEKCSQCISNDACYGGCWVMRINKQHCIYSLLSRA